MSRRTDRVLKNSRPTSRLVKAGRLAAELLRHWWILALVVVMLGMAIVARCAQS